MIISSKKHFLFTSLDGDKFDVPRAYIGAIPDWVGKTELFKMAVNDKTITMVGEPQKIGVGNDLKPETQETSKKNK